MTVRTNLQPQAQYLESSLHWKWALEQTGRFERRCDLPDWLAALPALRATPSTWKGARVAKSAPDVTVRRDGSELHVALDRRGLPDGFDIDAAADADGKAAAFVAYSDELDRKLVALVEALVAQQRSFFLREAELSPTVDEESMARALSLDRRALQRMAYTRTLETSGTIVPLWSFFSTGAQMKQAIFGMGMPPSLKRAIGLMQMTRMEVRAMLPRWLDELPGLRPVPARWADVPLAADAPDVVVTLDGTVVSVELNRHGLPEAYEVDGASDADGDAVLFVQGVGRAEQLLVDIVRALVARERPFFSGKRAPRFMTTEREVADELGINFSTVARICERRTLGWKGQLVPLSALFFRGSLAEAVVLPGGKISIPRGDGRKKVIRMKSVEAAPTARKKRAPKKAR